VDFLGDVTAVVQIPGNTSLAHCKSTRPFSRFRWQVGKAEPNLPDSPGTLDFMRRYLGDFESARKAASTDEALIAAMKQQYPGLKQEKFLVNANAAFLHSPGQ